jgi:hypothetical protein
MVSENICGSIKQAFICFPKSCVFVVVLCEPWFGSMVI